MRERTEIYDREKLYEEVWKEPVLVVAKRYGVSDVALAKACRKLGVPLPPRGYWAAIRSGRKGPPHPPLPPYDPSKIQKTWSETGRVANGEISKETEEKPGRKPVISTHGVAKKSDRPTGTGSKAEEKKGTGKKTIPKEIPEYLYCTIDGWQRTFRFGVNLFRSKEEIRFKENVYDEWDHLQVFATVRYHHKSIKGRKRTGQQVELWLHPTHVPRKDWRDDPDAIGGVWTQQGKLFGTLAIPADSFYSLFPCLTSNHFKELELSLIRMHYRNGDIYGIAFRPKETPMEDLLE